MSERRYSEREIREVFERAARDQEQAKAHASQEGLTLDEMQEIAASAGIAPEFVASAAQSVALGEPEQGHMMTGPIPRGVFRTEFLPGLPTEELWNELVADLRRTFEARGKVTKTERVWEWRNGNLRVTLEPAGDGSRLHLQTRRDERFGVISILTALALFPVLVLFLGSLTGSLEPEKIVALVSVGVSATLGAAGVWLNQRSWAATRERQMEAIAQRAGALSHTASPMPSGLPASSPQLDPDLLNLDAPDSEALPSGIRTRS